VALDLCRALAAVHAAGLIHGDVKAANVIREQGGRIVLTDFGSGSDIDADCAAFGSPAVLAPEVLEGAAPSPVTDIYSLGVLMYRLVSGRYPVQADDLSELRDAHREGSRRPLRDHRPDLAADFVQVVERASHPDPERRFASAGELEQALLEAHGEVGPQADSAQPDFASGRQPADWSRWWLAAAAVPVIALAAFLFYLVTGPRPEAAREAMAPPKPAASTPQPGARINTPHVDQVVVAEETTRSAAREPIAPPPLRAAAALLRRRGGVSETLPSGARLAPGDHLCMEVGSTEPVHLYIVNQDRQGALFVLFPLAGLDLGNPLPAGQHLLPGPRAGEPQDWQVTSLGGTETFVVVASRQRLPDFERELARLQAAGAASDSDTERGVGGLAPAGETGAPGLAPLLHDLELRRQRDGSVWLTSFQLDNP
jgi:hypothetical protein